jgi:glycosyltransferase involved in cell wall biosynthesis
MKIYIHSLHYNPTNKPISRLLSDLVIEMTDRGHEVIILTSCFGQEPKPISNERIVKIYNFGGLSETFVLKILDYFSFYFQSMIVSIVNGSLKKDSITIMRSGFGISSFFAYLLRKVLKVKIVFWVLDRYPDILLENKLFKHGFLFNILKKLEIYFEKNMNVVIFETKSDLYDYKSFGGLNNSKLIRTWYENFDNVEPIKPKFLKKVDTSKELCLFSGNIGNSTDIIAMVDFFKKNEDRYYLLVVGSGSNKENLVNECRHKKLSNVFFNEFLSFPEYYHILKNSSYGVVSLKEDITIFSSKITTYLACDLPVLAFLSNGNEMSDLVKETGCGVVLNNDMGDVNELNRKQLLKGVAKAKLMFNPKHNINKFLSTVENV